MKIKKESNYLEIQDLNIEWEEFKEFFEFLKTDKMWGDFKIVNCYNSYNKIIFIIDKEEYETELWPTNPSNWKWEFKRKKHSLEKRYIDILYLADVLLKTIWKDNMQVLLKKYFSNQPYLIDSDITIIGV